MCTFSWDRSFQVWPPWQAGEWMRDSSYVPEPMADTQQLQMYHKVIVCLLAFFKPEEVLKFI